MLGCSRFVINRVFVKVLVDIPCRPIQIMLLVFIMTELFIKSIDYPDWSFSHQKDTELSYWQHLIKKKLRIYALLRIFAFELLSYWANWMCSWIYCLAASWLLSQCHRAVLRGNNIACSPSIVTYHRVLSRPLLVINLQRDARLFTICYQQRFCQSTGWYTM